MTAATFDGPQAPQAPTRASLKTWWNHFTFAQKAKREAEEKKGECAALVGFRARRLIASGDSGGPRDTSHGRRLREAPQGQPRLRERANFDRKRERGALCVGIHPRRGSKVVRLPYPLPYRSVDANRALCSGLYLKENGTASLALSVA